ncbi:hypothetical protein ACUR5C_11470 [Aliikangiella sp. IMCC44653]
MRKLLIISAIATLGFASSVSAQILGSVIVNSTNTSMTGQFNVGTSPTAGHANSYIWGNGYANSSIGFGGRDAVSGRSFYCTIPVGNALYDAAVNIRNNLGPMTYLRVNKSSTSSTCTSVFVLKDSRRHG